MIIILRINRVHDSPFRRKPVICSKIRALQERKPWNSRRTAMTCSTNKVFWVGAGTRAARELYKANVAGCIEVAGLYRGLNRSHCEGSLNCHEWGLTYWWETVASGTSDTRVALGAISACPALFPCKNALPARNRLGVAQDTTCRVTPVGSSKEKRA